MAEVKLVSWKHLFYVTMSDNAQASKSKASEETGKDVAEPQHVETMQGPEQAEAGSSMKGGEGEKKKAGNGEPEKSIEEKGEKKAQDMGNTDEGKNVSGVNPAPQETLQWTMPNEDGNKEGEKGKQAPGETPGVDVVMEIDEDEEEKKRKANVMEQHLEAVREIEAADEWLEMEKKKKEKEEKKREAAVNRLKISKDNKKRVPSPRDLAVSKAEQPKKKTQSGMQNKPTTVERAISKEYAKQIRSGAKQGQRPEPKSVQSQGSQFTPLRKMSMISLSGNANEEEEIERGRPKERTTPGSKRKASKSYGASDERREDKRLKDTEGSSKDVMPKDNEVTIATSIDDPNHILYRARKILEEMEADQMLSAPESPITPKNLNAELSLDESEGDAEMVSEGENIGTAAEGKMKGEEGMKKRQTLLDRLEDTDVKQFVMESKERGAYIIYMGTEEWLQQLKRLEDIGEMEHLVKTEVGMKAFWMHAILGHIRFWKDSVLNEISNERMRELLKISGYGESEMRYKIGEMNEMKKSVGQYIQYEMMDESRLIAKNAMTVGPLLKKERISLLGGKEHMPYIQGERSVGFGMTFRMLQGEGDIVDRFVGKLREIMKWSGWIYSLHKRAGTPQPKPIFQLVKKEAMAEWTKLMTIANAEACKISGAFKNRGDQNKMLKRSREEYMGKYETKAKLSKMHEKLVQKMAGQVVKNPKEVIVPDEEKGPAEKGKKTGEGEWERGQKKSGTYDKAKEKGRKSILPRKGEDSKGQKGGKNKGAKESGKIQGGKKQQDYWGGSEGSANWVGADKWAERQEKETGWNEWHGGKGNKWKEAEHGSSSSGWKNYNEGEDKWGTKNW